MKYLTLSFWLVALSAMSQTIVSTTPENAKIILEEFTGIYCVYCPLGHEEAQNIQNNNPGNVFLISIHQGAFAVPQGGDPDFRTPWGNDIANQSELVGYPAATVNRLFFQGLAQNGANGTAMGRLDWQQAVDQTLNTSAYVNLGVESFLDASQGVLTIHVEAYYTGDSPLSENYLNVALLQNNTLGPQQGGNMGNEYNHMHRLVDLITGQFGEEITTTTAGSFIDRTYTYTIPAEYNGVPTQLGDLEVVVFMAESSQHIISGNGGYPSIEGNFQNDLAIAEITPINEVCYGVLAPQIVLQNSGLQTATSVDIVYEINGQSYSYTWNGSLDSLEQTLVTLPGQEFPFNGTNVVSVTLANDDYNGNNDQEISFTEAQEYEGNLYLTIDNDGFASEFTWDIVDYNGAVYASGGPYAPFESVSLPIAMNTESCYTFTLYDSGSDGGAEVLLRDAAYNTILETDGEFGASLDKTFGFKIETMLGTQDAAFANAVILSPNPAKNQVQISGIFETTHYKIFNVIGQNIKYGQVFEDRSIDLSGLNPGVYFVHLNQNNVSCVKKLVIE